MCAARRLGLGSRHCRGWGCGLGSLLYFPTLPRGHQVSDAPHRTISRIKGHRRQDASSLPSPCLPRTSYTSSTTIMGYLKPHFVPTASQCGLCTLGDVEGRARGEGSTHQSLRVPWPRVLYNQGFVGMSVNPGPRMITEAKKSPCRAGRGLAGTQAKAPLGRSALKDATRHVSCSRGFSGGRRAEELIPWLTNRVRSFISDPEEDNLCASFS